MRRPHVAILGATGVVGRELLSILEEREFPLASLTLLASPRSAGTKIAFRGEELTVESADDESFRGIDLVLASAGAKATRALRRAIESSGALLIDNSSAFRMDPHVPLVVPEVNGEEIAKHSGIIANPNCVAIIMSVAVAPIHRIATVERIVVSTYQSASGAGIEAMRELEAQCRDVLDGRGAVPRALLHPIAFNVFSHDASIEEDGYNGEESKVIAETRKIFGAPDMRVTATSIRVPVFRAHSESINLTLRRPITDAEARHVLEGAEGVVVIDDRANNTFPMPVTATNNDAVYVGRIRSDVSQPEGMGLELFVCGDQLRKGAALNAIQIAERV